MWIEISTLCAQIGTVSIETLIIISTDLPALAVAATAAAAAAYYAAVMMSSSRRNGAAAAAAATQLRVGSTHVIHVWLDSCSSCNSIRRRVWWDVVLLVIVCAGWGCCCCYFNALELNEQTNYVCLRSTSSLFEQHLRKKHSYHKSASEAEDRKKTVRGQQEILQQSTQSPEELFWYILMFVVYVVGRIVVLVGSHWTLRLLEAETTEQFQTCPSRVCLCWYSSPSTWSKYKRPMLRPTPQRFPVPISSDCRVEDVPAVCLAHCRHSARPMSRLDLELAASEAAVAEGRAANRSPFRCARTSSIMKRSCQTFWTISDKKTQASRFMRFSHLSRSVKTNVHLGINFVIRAHVSC